MKITWYGHAAFRLELAGTAVLIDPFLSHNPMFTSTVEEASQGVSHILLTHGHGDHVGDTVAIAKATGATVVANADLCGWLGTQGLDKLEMMNTGGTIHLPGFTVSMVRADHSSGMVVDGASVYLGNANGLIVKAPGEPTLWHMGDTDIFSDMALIAEIHRPDIVILPIGDRFTMGPETAAVAVTRYLGGLTIIPAHYATFGLLEPNADRFVALVGEEATVVVPPVGVAQDFPKL
ncbi:metal-dependent hydrolase [Ancylobacter sp. SL191]|uniref:metal-dependent hydrolase n=1 Tax=Ancylobacter sp. SL191 TaxID=2995166 RepID=UPI00227213A5|nr:metal-dependent hydrolase [Ancylobacter sp. SL191]WAC29605.1 metal-dependent hydrolase [Ancylobacter sp. SL191]